MFQLSRNHTPQLPRESLCQGGGREAPNGSRTSVSGRTMQVWIDGWIFESFKLLQMVQSVVVDCPIQINSDLGSLSCIEIHLLPSLNILGGGSGGVMCAAFC